jgi:hypothetical protein
MFLGNLPRSFDVESVAQKAQKLHEVAFVRDERMFGAALFVAQVGEKFCRADGGRGLKGE